MVKSYAHKIEGEWLRSPSAAKIRNAAYRFNSEADPLYQKTVAANQQTEAERRNEQSDGSGDSEEDTRSHKREVSKPEPVLKPRSQQGRHRDLSEPWLKAQYEAARKHAKPAVSKKTSPDNAPRQTRDHTP